MSSGYLHQKIRSQSERFYLATAAREAQARLRASQPDHDLDLLRFIPHTSRGLLEPPHHLKPYVDLLQSCIGSGRRVVVAAPPQHGKTLTSLYWLVWALQRHPGKQFAYCTYAQTRSERQSWLTQQIAIDAGSTPDGPRGGWRIENGASMVFTSIGGALTGEPVSGGMLIDDPFSGPKDAYSPAFRQKAIDWYDTVASTRLHPGVPSIVMATRWHPDDLSGLLIKRGWEYINIPAIAESEDDPLQRQLGEALWPEHRPLEMLLEQRRANAHSFASLYQGRPRPRGDAVFGDPTFYTALPETYRVGYGIDLAYSARTHADWSVLVTLYRDGDHVYVVDVARRQCKAPAFRGIIESTLARHGHGPMRWYCAGPEKGVADLLSVRGMQAMAATADKLVRAQPVAEAWNLGRVLVPHDAAWLANFLEIVTGFTGVNDAHDDDVDALAAGFDALQQTGYQGVSYSPSRALDADDDDDWD